MTPRYQPWLHRFAVFTAASALLPITVGALVTTMDAGMAFLDWPSSDGHNMLLYPWFQSLRADPDKFVEHGHRLTAVIAGLASIGLAVAMWFGETRRWARWVGVCLLACVIGQGLLGGTRVLMAARGLAMLHGLFGSWVFAFMSCVAVMTSKAWFESDRIKTEDWSLGTGISAVVAVVAIQLQFILGGLLRHQGMALLEHLGFAFLVLLTVMWLWVGAYSSGVTWLRGNATALVIAVIAQMSLGVMTLIAKFGTFEMTNYVPVQGSMTQVWTRTGHTILGMMVWMLAVVYLLRVVRIMWLRQRNGVSANIAVCNGGLATGGAP